MRGSDDAGVVAQVAQIVRLDSLAVDGGWCTGKGMGRGCESD